MGGAGELAAKGALRAAEVEEVKKVGRRVGGPARGSAVLPGAIASSLTWMHHSYVIVSVIVS
jgi:hypothetical protein